MGKMHTDEVDIDGMLVQRLLATQLPDWAALSITPVPSAGTDNALYRLGADRVVRLPRTPSAAVSLQKEQQWLAQLAPQLPLAIPVPLAIGQAGAGYPWTWSVYRWLDGENATLDRLSDPVRAAQDLARFIRALQQIDATSGPPPGPHNFFRGVRLAERDDQTRAAIAESRGLIDTTAAAAAWDTALNVAAWDDPPVWIHGDLQSGNLLAQNGQLSAVIDFGGLGVGDPACDLQPAWNLFDSAARDAFRATLAVDNAMWARGKGWSLSVGLIALPYYQTTNPVLAAISRRAIEAVLADHTRTP